MNLNQSFNWHQTRRKQNLVSAKSASLELVPETTSDLENYTTETPGRHQEELNWYRTLYEQTPSIFFALDVTGVILSVNKFGANCLGYEPCDLIQKLFFNIFCCRSVCKMLFLTFIFACCIFVPSSRCCSTDIFCTLGFGSSGILRTFESFLGDHSSH